MERNLNGNSNIYCPYCGTIIEGDSKYCHHCGAYLEQEKVEDSSPAIRIISERPISEFPNIDIRPLQLQYPTNTTTNFYQGNHNSQNSSYNQTQNTSLYVHKTEKHNDVLGVISIVFAILAFIGILPFIGSIVAIIIGGKKSGPLGIIGRILGVISLIIYTVFAFLMFL